jgi:putative phosphoesterase
VTQRANELLVVADTHGAVAVLAAVLAWGKKRGIGALAFLGDGVDDLPTAADRVGFHPPWKRVRGNGDGNHAVPFVDTMDFAGHRFFLCHGHLNGVQDGFVPIVSAARSVDAEVALFGHTHRPFWEEMSGILVLNPGSPVYPRGGYAPSFATIACPSDGWFEVRHWALAEGALGGISIRAYEPLGS